MAGPGGPHLVASPTLRAQLIIQQGGGAQILTSASTSPPTSMPTVFARLPQVTSAAVALAPSTGMSGLAIGLSQGELVRVAFGTQNTTPQALPGSFAAADVAPVSIFGTSYFAIVGASAGGLTLQLTDDVAKTTGSPFAMSSIPVMSDLLATFDGTHVATAWNAGVLAVAWLTKHQLAAGDPKGGWALFSCP